MRRCLFACFALLAFVSISFAQIVGGNAVVGGVKISADGLLQFRQPAGGLPAAPVFTATPKDHSMVYISLPRALERWRAAREKDAAAELPPELRYLQGMTQIRALFLFPAQHDIVLAGPAEPVRADNPLEAVGSATGRPLLQLEDLIVAMRSIGGWGGTSARRQEFFGCSLEPPGNLAAVWGPTLQKFGNGPRAKLVEELKKGLGPQPVKLFGVPDDSRVAAVMVAADYRLKRLSMGLETLPGLGNGLGTVDAGVRFWFEPTYEAVVTSPNLPGTEGATGYELRGNRLKVLAGTRLFENSPVGAAQAQFADRLTAKIPDVASRIDGIADLQNVMDCFMVAALLREDQLFDKAGIDAAWILDAHTYKVGVVPVPRTAETVVHINGNVIAQGGVAVSLNRMMGVRKAGEGSLATAARRPADWFERVAKPE
jgi:hypothetical protein